MLHVGKRLLHLTNTHAIKPIYKPIYAWATIGFYGAGGLLDVTLCTVLLLLHSCLLPLVISRTYIVMV